MTLKRSARTSSKQGLAEADSVSDRLATDVLASEDSALGELVKELRIKAGLSQRELARRVGTTASVICRLENHEYRGHSIDMLRRIGQSVGMKVVVGYVPIRPNIRVITERPRPPAEDDTPVLLPTPLSHSNNVIAASTRP